MTGGIVVVLGNVGYNVGGGMTGGHAYILDEEDTLPHKINPSYVYIRRLVGEEEISELRQLIEEHYKYTSSSRAREILERFDEYLPKFWKVIPLEQKDRDPYREREPEEVAKV